MISWEDEEDEEEDESEQSWCFFRYGIQNSKKKLSLQKFFSVREKIFQKISQVPMGSFPMGIVLVFFLKFFFFPLELF